jgi:hypothetical protein
MKTFKSTSTIGRSANGTNVQRQDAIGDKGIHQGAGTKRSKPRPHQGTGKSTKEMRPGPRIARPRRPAIENREGTPERIEGSVSGWREEPTQPTKRPLPRGKLQDVPTTHRTHTAEDNLAPLDHEKVQVRHSGLHQGPTNVHDGPRLESSSVPTSRRPGKQTNRSLTAPKGHDQPHTTHTERQGTSRRKIQDDTPNSRGLRNPTMVHRPTHDGTRGSPNQTSRPQRPGPTHNQGQRSRQGRIQQTERRQHNGTDKPPSWGPSGTPRKPPNVHQGDSTSSEASPERRQPRIPGGNHAECRADRLATSHGLRRRIRGRIQTTSHRSTSSPVRKNEYQAVSQTTNTLVSRRAHLTNWLKPKVRVPYVLPPADYLYRQAINHVISVAFEAPLASLEAGSRSVTKEEF